jgi:hypothetical protein
MNRKRLTIPFVIPAHDSLLFIISLTYSIPVFSGAVKELYASGFDKFHKPKYNEVT